MPSRTISRAPRKSFETTLPLRSLGKPPTTSTRQRARSATASSTARRLSSSAARRPSRSIAGNMPPRHSPVTVSPASRMRCAVSLRPVAATWSRQGAMPRMLCCTQPAMISGSFHCTRTVAVLSDSKSVSGLLISELDLDCSSVDAVQREQRAHPRSREIRVAQQTCAVGQPKELGQVNDAARALLAADHREVRLMTVQPCEENDSRLVKARWRCKDVTRQRYRRRQNAIERRAIAVRKRGQRRGSGGRDCVEDAEERIRVSVRVAADQRGEVEIIACVHPNARRKTTAQGNLLVGI